MNRTDVRALGTILWVCGLLTLCIGWGLLMNTAMYGAYQRLSDNIGVALGMGGPVFIVTSLGAGIAYALTRSRTKALWTWTILVLLSLTILGFGAARFVRPSEPAESVYDEILRERSPSRLETRPEQQTREPVATLSIDALLSEYRENEFAAAAKYENLESLRISCLVGDGLDGCRFVETAGDIRDMGRDANGVAYLRLATADPFVSVEARFADPEEAAEFQTLRHRQRLSVRCMVLYDRTLYGASGLLLTKCRIAP